MAIAGFPKLYVTLGSSNSGNRSGGSGGGSRSGGSRRKSGSQTTQSR
jgi:hypothetical protein